MKHIFCLLLLVVFIISCNGQDAPPVPRGDGGNAGILSAGQSGMVRTQGAKSGNVGTGLLDRAGNLWFGTGGEGVYRYDGKSFTNFTVKDGLNNNHVSAMIEDKAGNILFGTGSGICRYDGKSFAPYPGIDGVGTLSITSLLEDREGNLWFGAMNKGVYRYDGTTLANFLNNDDHPFNLGTHNQLVLDMLQDKSGNIWFCTWNGGGVWRYNGKTFKNFLPPADYYVANEDHRALPGSGESFAPRYLPKISAQPQDNITDDMIFSVSEDKAGNLWFATRDHGVCRYDGTAFTGFREKEGFASRGAYSILEDRNGNFWVTTDKNGVWRYDGTTFTNFTTVDGLVNNSVFSVVEDKDGNLWFGTRGFGLSRYDGTTFTTFSE